MKNLFAYDFTTNTYYASKTTLKKASNPNSAEYKALMKLMSQNPKASVAEKYIKPAIGIAKPSCGSFLEDFHSLAT